MNKIQAVKKPRCWWRHLAVGADTAWRKPVSDHVIDRGTVLHSNGDFTDVTIDSRVHLRYQISNISRLHVRMTLAAYLSRKYI